MDHESRRRRWDLVLPYREEMLRVARRRVPSPRDAEDCVQEALVRVVQYDGLDERQVSGFLFTTLVRLCADQHRHTSRSGRAVARLSAWDAVEPPPDEAVCDRAEAAWMARHIEALPVRQREILAARANGMTCGEVADRYAVSYKTVESALSRARARLRAALAATLALGVGLAHRARYAAPAVVGVSALAVATVTLVDRAPVAPAPARPPATAEVELVFPVGAAPGPGSTAEPGVRSGSSPSAGPAPTAEPARPPVEASAGPVRVGGDPDNPDPSRGPVPRAFDCVLLGVERSPSNYVRCRYPTESPSP